MEDLEKLDLTSPEEYISYTNITNVIRVDENNIKVLFPNGGYVRLNSESPIIAYVKAE
jgi:hypothetical protein